MSTASPPVPSPTPPCRGSLGVSLVSYAPDRAVLRQTLTSLRRAVETAALPATTRLSLIDNGPGDQSPLLAAIADETIGDRLMVETLSGHGNIGYGAGHDLALLRKDGPDFHLILNPDVCMADDALAVGLDYLRATPEAVLVSPEVTGSRGEFQYLCKRPPGLLTLLLRGFAPPMVRRWFHPLLDRYEMRDVLRPGLSTPVHGVPMASGCFMLLRRQAAVAVGGFTNAYFLYFEDNDLCLRLGRIGRLDYLPTMRIHHFGGYAARKGWHHIRLFGASAWTYYRRNGWKLL